MEPYRLLERQVRRIELRHETVALPIGFRRIAHEVDMRVPMHLVVAYEDGPVERRDRARLSAHVRAGQSPARAIVFAERERSLFLHVLEPDISAQERQRHDGGELSFSKQ